MLADKIVEVSDDLDRMIARGRGIAGPWSFLADSPNEVQAVSLSGVASGGTFGLTFGAATATLAFNATAGEVLSGLAALAGVGTGNVAVVGPPGGPWQVTFGGTLVGPQPLLVGTSSLVPAASRVAVQELVRGVAAVPSVRSFTLTAAPWDTWLIDDCVSIAAVAYRETPSAAPRPLVGGTDYLVVPATGTPIVALRKAVGRWPRGALIDVRATWGYGATIPPGAREVTGVEVIRSYLADRAGNDDRLGITPFGQVITAKAWTQKTWQFVQDVSFGAGSLRR